MEGLKTILSGIAKQEQFCFEWQKDGQEKENLKILLDSLREKSYNVITTADLIHCQNNLELKELEEEYGRLELDKEAKKVTDSLLSKIDELEFDIANNSYLAGIIDSYMLLKYMGLVKE